MYLCPRVHVQLRSVGGEKNPLWGAPWKVCIAQRKTGIKGEVAKMDKCMDVVLSVGKAEGCGK